MALSFVKKYRVILILFLLFGCTSCATQKDPRKKAHLSIQADPYSLDPRIGGDRRSQIILRQLYEGLTRLGKDGHIENALAKRIDISEDQTVYTFHLRPSVWSNKTPLTAHDFEYAWKGALHPSFSSPFTYAFFVIKNAKEAKMEECTLDEVGVRALDDHTLQVTLEHPTPYFLELTANPIFSPLCQETIKKQATWPKVEDGTYVSNGPYLLQEQALKSHLLLQKNETYWNEDCAKLDALQFSIIEDPNTAYALFLQKELDWYGDPCCIIPIDIMRNFPRPLIRKNIGGLFWFVSCTEKPYLASPKIRKALACAVNREELVNFLQGGEVPAYSNLPPFMTMQKEHSFNDNDPQMAQKLFEEGLAESGYTKSTYPGLKITHWSESATKSIAELLQQQIQKALGIKVTLECLDWPTYMKKVPAGEIDIAIASWYSWVTDPMFNLNYLKFRKNGINGTCWEYPPYIEELSAADRCTNAAERTAHMAAAEKIFCENLPLIPLYYLSYRYAKSDNLSGEVVSPVGAFEFKWLEKKEQ